MTDMLSHLAEDLIAKHAIRSGKIFLSYSRKNREYARALYEKLDRMGFDLWRDVHDIEADSDDWWQSIQTAIENCETMILCMSLPALKSPVISNEWLHARKHQKRVIPVVADDIWTHPEVNDKEAPFVIPNWMQRKNWMDFRAGLPENDAAWANLIGTLNEKPDVKRFISMVSELPPRFVSRPAELNRAVGALVDDNHDAVAMTTALKGAGGYGKTTLAKAIARDARIQGAFDDGILWVTLGEELLKKQGDELQFALINLVQELIYALKTERPVITSLEMARTQLQEAIGDAYILVVIDDAWDERHLAPFLVKTKHSSCLITTRSTDALGKQAIVHQPIDKMQPLEAVELLSAGIPAEDVAPHRAALQALARDLREYPLLLGLVNAQMTSFIEDLHISVDEALDLAREALKDGGVFGFDDSNSDARDKAVSNTLEASIRQLKPEDRQRMYRELAIFAEDAVIPLSTLERFWGLNKIATLKFCQMLYRKAALIHSFEGMAIRIHDVFRDCLIRHWTPDEHQTLHRRLIARWGDLKALPDAYAWRYIAYHLIQANQPDTLYSLLVDYLWLQSKLKALDISDLLEDYKSLLQVSHGETERLSIQHIHQALSLSIHTISKDKSWLAAQLIGRLWPVNYYNYKNVQLLISNIYKQKSHPYLLPQCAAYDDLAGGPCLARFLGHDAQILGAFELHDFIYSWDKEKLIQWTKDGVIIQTLLRTRIAEITDNVLKSELNVKIATMETYPKIRIESRPLFKEFDEYFSIKIDSDISLIWNDWIPYLMRVIISEKYIPILKGHQGKVLGAVLLTDQTVLTWSLDNTLRRWDITKQTIQQSSWITEIKRGHQNLYYNPLNDSRILAYTFVDDYLYSYHIDGDFEDNVEIIKNRVDDKFIDLENSKLSPDDEGFNGIELYNLKKLPTSVDRITVDFEDTHITIIDKNTNNELAVFEAETPIMCVGILETGSEFIIMASEENGRMLSLRFQPSHEWSNHNYARKLMEG